VYNSSTKRRLHLHLIIGYDPGLSQEVPFAFCNSVMPESRVFQLFKPRKGLISDTWFIEPHDIKCIFLGGGPTHNSLLLGLSGVACALHYSTSLAHPNNTKQNKMVNCLLDWNCFGHNWIDEKLCALRRPVAHSSFNFSFDSMVKSRPFLICDIFLFWI